MFQDVQVNIVLIPIAIGLVQVIKMIPFIDKRDYAKAVLSLLVGVGLVLLDNAMPVRQMILGGLVVGLSAMGLYTGGKAGVKAISNE